MINILWILFAFVGGSLPCSVWLGQVALKTDIRQYGDGNPGGTNVGRAGGWYWGVLAVILDMLKGGIPVGLAWYFGGVSGSWLVAVALAPILGHAYSPFLGFQGGKAIAVTGGVWGGLSFGEMTVVMALLLLLWYASLAVDGWVVLFALLSFLGYLFFRQVDSTLILIWGGTLIIIVWKHRADLQQPLRLRNWLLELLQKLQKW